MILRGGVFDEAPVTDCFRLTGFSLLISPPDNSLKDKLRFSESPEPFRLRLATEYNLCNS